MRRAARKDANHTAILEYAVAHGWLGETISAPGFPDVVFLRQGMVLPVELKTAAGKMKPTQVDLHMRWERAGVIIPVVTSGPECVAVLRGERQPRTYRDFPWEGVPEAEKRKRLALTPALR